MCLFMVAHFLWDTRYNGGWRGRRKSRLNGPYILISQSQSWLPMLICIEIYIRMCVHSSADLWSERQPRKCSGAKFMANHNAKVRYGGASPNPEACATSSLGSDFYPRTPRGPSAPSRYPTAALWKWKIKNSVTSYAAFIGVLHNTFALHVCWRFQNTFAF